MNWYKFSLFDIQDFDDRNVVNSNIMFLETVIEYLTKLAKVVFQDGRLARSVNSKIVNHKKISSYPKVKEVLRAADKIALDSPWKFAAFCHIGIYEIDKKLSQLKIDRDEFSNKTLPERLKGFRDAK
tara:strand:- start:456 stop:836 length:381 start_codon:yes stop_codon:yes gene_type:complete